MASMISHTFLKVSSQNMPCPTRKKRVINLTVLFYCLFVLFYYGFNLLNYVNISIIMLLLIQLIEQQVLYCNENIYCEYI